MEYIQKLINRYKEVLVYLIFGALTTLVNYLVYFPLYNWLSLSAAISNIIAWFVAVLFAYFTNKPFVFHSNNWSIAFVAQEFLKFLGCRIASGLLETVILWITVDHLAYNGNVLKILVSILVVIINFVSSKWIVFKKKE